MLETLAKPAPARDTGRKYAVMPSIYYFFPQLAGPIEEWAAHFARAKTMGFDVVLLGAPAPAEIRPVADAARRTGVALWVDLEMELADGARIGAFQQAGVLGFRCLDLGQTAPDACARLIAEARSRAAGMVFAAWTPGLSAPAIAGLGAAHFDFAFSSSAWWDFQSAWIDEDAERIATVGRTIAMPEPPGAFRCADVTGDGRASRRAMALSAFYAAGWMVPMGFEFGAQTQQFRSTEEARAAFARLQAEPLFDLSGEIADMNAARAEWTALPGARLASPPGAEVAVLRRGRPDEPGLVLVIDPSLETGVDVPAARLLPLLGGVTLLRGQAPVSDLVLKPGQAEWLRAVPNPPVLIPRHDPDFDLARIAIEGILPKVDDGSFPVRRIVGETLVVEADLIADGHEKLAADVMYRARDRDEWQRVPMALVANDRWRAKFLLERVGRHCFKVAAWWDDYASCVDRIAKKHAANVAIAVEIEEALQEIRAAGLADLLTKIEAADQEERRQILTAPATVARVREAAVRRFYTESGEVIVDSERERAGFAAWYEVFPRSQSGDKARHGTFRDVVARLPAIRDMGFDVLYFPPIHPIGRVNRKGRNNSLIAGPEDPGSPYAIGSAEGGHDAIHPQLGMLEDFHLLRDRAAEFGMELALDFAIQCAPDHPWLKAHPDWFDWLPDGSLRYAENPPKKYEDIVNVDFYAPGAIPSLWIALRDVVEFWAEQGVRLFRVDNPHTKPLPFWQWMIGDIRARYPDAVFLAEAFTRPKVMYRLAKAGFSQSYTYFTWRNTKRELTEYLTELTTTPVREYFRPHFFVNTPDINPFFLQTSGRPGFLIRAALAATLSGLWGVYNGFELCEATPLPGKEEYLDSEKYEIRVWDYDRRGNIKAEITRLNRIRKQNRALESHLGVEFLNAWNEQILYFLKRGADGNTLVVAVTLDPFAVQEADIELPLWKFGLPDSGVLQVEDLMRDQKFVLQGKMQHIRLDPHELPFLIWRLSAITH